MQLSLSERARLFSGGAGALAFSVPSKSSVSKALADWQNAPLSWLIARSRGERVLETR